MAHRAFWSWAPSCSRYRASKRSTPTSDTSEARRSGLLGTRLAFRRCSSTTSARGACAARSARALVVVILRTLSRLDDARDGRAVDGSDRHRVAGAHLRRVLDDAGSRPAGLPAPHEGPAHIVA